MDILDAQVHLNKFGIDAGIEAMNALGIAAVLIDEFHGLDSESTPQPNLPLPGGGYRPLTPIAEAASLRYPDRLAYLRRVDYRDPDADAIVRLLRADPGARAMRISVRGQGEIDAFVDGQYGRVFEAARTYGFPMFVLLRDHAPLLRPYLERFADVQFILCHCGLPPTPAEYDDVLALARYENLALKWAHAARIFPNNGWPFRELDQYLERALERFGPQRLLWASDTTESHGSWTWAEALFYVRDTPVLSAGDREWVLARTARTILRWPAATAG